MHSALQNGMLCALRKLLRSKQAPGAESVVSRAMKRAGWARLHYISVAKSQPSPMAHTP